MESVTHSRQPKVSVTLPNKITNGNFSSTKTLYDDVYGGPPKFTASISPRFEDYGEIFASFHSARSSSIPVLDLPAVDAGEIFFDFRKAAFDYGEVFGDFGGLDFLSSHEDLFCDGDSVEEEKEEEAWTPVEADSFSGDLDHFGNQGVSSGGLFQSVDGNMEFNISYHKVNGTSNEDVSKRKAHTTQLHAVPGVTRVVDETTLFPRTEPSLQVVDDIDLDMEFNAGKEKRSRHKKMMPQACNVTSGEQIHCCDLELHDECNRNDSHSTEMFISVSDISLRTIPSQLPPPCRPPPVLDTSKGYTSEFHSNNEQIDSEDTLDDGSPPFFDVEVDINSSASVVKQATDRPEAKVRSAKDLKGRKKQGSESSIKSGYDVKTNEANMCENITGFNSLNDERVLATCDRRSAKVKISAPDERQKTRMAAPVTPESLEGERLLNMNEEKHMKESRSSQESDQSIGVGIWKEATEFFELVGTEESRKVIHPINPSKSLVEDARTFEHVRKEAEASNVQEEYRKVKAILESYQPDEYKKKPKAARGAYEQGKNIRRSKSSNVECRQREPVRNDEITEPLGLEKNEKKIRMVHQHGKTEKKVSKANHVGSEISKEIDGQEPSDVQCSLNLKENEKKLNQDEEHHLSVKKHEQSQIMKENEKTQREAFAPEATESEERVKDTGELEKINGRSHEAIKLDKPEKSITCKRENKIISKQHIQNRSGLKEACESEENEKSLKGSFKNEESGEGRKHTNGQVVNGNGLKEEDFEPGLNKTKTKEAFEQGTDEACVKDQSKENFREVCDEYGKGNRVEETSDSQGTWKVQKQAQELERHSEIAARMKQENESLSNQTSDGEGTLGISIENSHSKQSEKILKDVSRSENDEGFDEALEQMEVNREGMSLEFAKETNATCKAQSGECLLAAHSSTIHGENIGKLEVPLEPVADYEIGEAITDCEIGGKKLEEVGVENITANGNITSFEMSQGKEGSGTQPGKVDCSARNTDELCFSSEQACSEKAKISPQTGFDSESQERKISREWGESRTIKHHVNVALNQERSRNQKSSSQGNTCDDYRRNTAVDEPAGVQEAVNVHSTSQRSRVAHSTKSKEKSRSETSASVEKDAEKMRVEKEMERERVRKIEEELERERERQKDREELERERERQKDRMAVDRAMLEAEREREREKDRTAVDRATFEARDRAYAEARERAERAAFDRATAEARQRALAEARERLEKACAEARDKSYADKVTAEARLKAERAAVERATAEARERAMEKVKVEIAVFGSRERLERSVSDKFGVSSRNDGRQGSSSSDMPDPQFHNFSSANGARYPYSAYGASSFSERSEEGESAQRYRARLERYRRTADRAAKALEEKNMRDLIAQKEQAERSRLAETLDTEVKRWSSGKEGNLRALLSTLQYILGHDSGWQPIPLTEVITSAAVKKAYRKATLCVHPDKLQQRGASIQHKYICEKVFDLLKEAWNKFNSEER